MANTNVGFGLKPINTAGSTPATSGTNTYFIDSSASAIYQGSPVIATNGGEIAVSGSASGDTLKFVGVFAGCEYVSSATGKKVFSNFWPGSGADTNFDIIGFVYDNPMQRFIICSDASLTNKATAIATIFEGAEFSAESGKGAADGSTTTGISAAQLDRSPPLKIVGILDDPENADFTAAGIPLIVMINNHALLTGSAEATVS